MKQYTTPTIQVTITGAEELLAAADDIILTVSDDVTDIDLNVTLDGDTVTAIMSELQTAQLQAGTVYVEVTIKIDDKVFKTKTLKTKLQEAIRNEVV